MSEIILSENPQGGSGAATLEAAAIPRVRSRIDTFANEAAPKQNYADGVKLSLNGGVSADNRQAFIFLARPFPLGSSILEATLKLHLAGAWTGTQTVTAKRITASWKENKLTWDDRPAASVTNSASVTVTGGTDAQEIELNLAPMLSDVSAGDEWYGVRLELDADATRKLYSSDYPQASLRPVLELNWVVPPLPPSQLSPAGEQSVSVSHPTLSWHFRDREQETQTESQVQISATESFTTPEYDSGWVANTVEQWDLGDTAYVGVTDGQTRFWRVRVKDEASLSSDWSDTEEFARNTKGALTIVNPAAAPNDYVEETTPPLDWTFTGRTQTRAVVKLLLLDDVDLPKKLLERWVVKTGTRVHVPRKTLKSVETYRMVVRAWDDFDRAETPGDPAYVEASRDFTYNRSGTPAAVTALTAVPSTTEPKVVLTWERALQPDYFSLRVDGKEVEDRIDPEDVFVSGTTYSMDWWLASPREVHIYEVEAVVVTTGKLKHSDGNSTATATVETTGIWLVDADDGTVVEIKGMDDLNFSIREVSETHDMVGSRRPVTITELIGGYTASFGGYILSRAGRDAMLALKGRIATELRLIVKDYNIPVELGADTQITPRPESQDRYDVSGTVVQVDDWPMDLTGD